MPRLPAGLARSGTLAESSPIFRDAGGNWMTGSALEKELRHAAALMDAARKYGPIKSNAKKYTPHVPTTAIEKYHHGELKRLSTAAINRAFPVKRARP